MKAHIKVTVTLELEGDFEGDTLHEMMATAEMEARRHGEVTCIVTESDLPEELRTKAKV